MHTNITHNIYIKSLYDSRYCHTNSTVIEYLVQYLGYYIVYYTV